MSSAQHDHTPSGDTDPDRTARARIRDVALRLFGERGFRSTTVRLIAERASVSPALVVHHFGSKQGLRDAIDRELADQIRDGEFAMMSGSMSMNRDEYMAMAADYEDALPYLSRAMAEGDEVGRRLFDRLHADAVEYLAVGEESGLVRPSEDPQARAAALLSASMGFLLMKGHVQRVLGADDEMEAMLGITPVILDLYTYGLFADDRALLTWHDRERHDAGTADPDPPAGPSNASWTAPRGHDHGHDHDHMQGPAT